MKYVFMSISILAFLFTVKDIYLAQSNGVKVSPFSACINMILITIWFVTYFSVQYLGAK